MIKLRQVPTVSVEDMLIQKNITTKPERWSMHPLNSHLIKVKMACGENPKYVRIGPKLTNRRVYGNAANWPGGPNSETPFPMWLIM